MYILINNSKINVFYQSQSQMRSYREEGFRVLPSTLPLKSPSPDIKGRSSIMPTSSPDNYSMKKSFDLYTPPNRVKKQSSYFQYCSVPTYNQAIPQNFSKLFQKTKKSIEDERQYSSTHAKPQQNPHPIKEMQGQLYEEQNKNDFLETGKKMYQHQQPKQSSQIDQSSREKDLQKAVQSQSKTIEQKDMIISELKSMINLMTQNGKHLKHSQSSIFEQDYENMKQQVKILTIQNQKLAQVIEKVKQRNQKLVSRYEHHQKSSQKKQQKPQQITDQQNMNTQQNNIQKIQSFQRQIERLKEKLLSKQTTYEKQIDELINSHKSLAIECKMYENEKQRYSKQNQSLINLLRLKEKQKETGYGNYSYIDKSQYDQHDADNKAGGSMKNGGQIKGSNDKLSIQKIKAQYEQNLKQYQQNVYNQVYNMFDTINSTLQEINQKTNTLQQKISSMQKFRNSLFKSRTNSHFTSLEQSEEDIKKSAIYIQEAPSSERISTNSKRSRDNLSVILEESRRDNYKLQMELSQLRKQVESYRQNLDANMDGKKYNQKKQQNENEEQIKCYTDRIKQLQNLVDELREEKEDKQKQLIELQCQILKVQQQRLVSRNIQKAQKKLQSDYSPIVKASSPPRSPTQQQLKHEISALRSQIQQGTDQRHLLQQTIADMEKALQIRQKQLLRQIEQLQTLIKLTQEVFKQYKQQSQTEHSTDKLQIQQLNGDVEVLKEENESLKGDTKILLEENSLQKINLENQYKKIIDEQIRKWEIEKQQNQHSFRLIKQKDDQNLRLQAEIQQLAKRISLNQQKITRLQSLVQKFKTLHSSISSYGSFLTSQALTHSTIQSQLFSLQQANQKLASQRSQLLNTINEAKEQIFQSKKQKIGLIERNNVLEKSLEIYKKQLDERTLMVETIKSQNNDKAQFIYQQTNSQIVTVKKSKSSRIHELLNQEKNKMADLLTLINKLSETETQI